ncbi:MAG: hypothetical protein ACRC0V_03890 [Fusobacteriaceae bacterium]
MIDRIQALGQFLVKKTGKNFDFKVIRADNFFKGVLFSIGETYYLVSDKEMETIDAASKMSHTRFCDYPAKFARKYTHMRFVKAEQKRSEIFMMKNKRYYIVTL